MGDIKHQGLMKDNDTVSIMTHHDAFRNFYSFLRVSLFHPRLAPSAALCCLGESAD